MLISLMYLTTRWRQVTNEEDAIMRPWASTVHSREQSESRSSFIRHLPFCLYVPSCPPSLTGRNILARLEITCRCCGNSSSAVPCYASACPLRWGSLVGKYFACRTESVANPLTMSRKSQHMTSRPSCPTTPLLVAWYH